MYINVIWTAFCYSLQVFNIYSARYVCYRFWALAVSIGTQPCKHCCQSMTLAHLTSKNRNSTSVHIPEIDFFISTLYIIITFPTAHAVKISILSLYNLGVCYRLSLLSTQSVQPLLRSDNRGLSQLLVSRKDTRSISLRVNLALPCLLKCKLNVPQKFYSFIDSKHILGKNTSFLLIVFCIIDSIFLFPM